MVFNIEEMIMKICNIINAPHINENTITNIDQMMLDIEKEFKSSGIEFDKMIYFAYKNDKKYPEINPILVLKTLNEFYSIINTPVSEKKPSGFFIEYRVNNINFIQIKYLFNFVIIIDESTNFSKKFTNVLLKNINKFERSYFKNYVANNGGFFSFVSFFISVYIFVFFTLVKTVRLNEDGKNALKIIKSGINSETELKDSILLILKRQMGNEFTENSYHTNYLSVSLVFLFLFLCIYFYIFSRPAKIISVHSIRFKIINNIDNFIYAGIFFSFVSYIITNYLQVIAR
jgi:hypothetical protein